MRKNEKELNLFISKLLDTSKIKHSSDGSNIIEIHKALKTASKSGTKKVGHPEFVGVSNNFIGLVYET